MLITEWVILVATSLSLFSAVMFFILVITFMRITKKLKVLKSEKPKSNRKKRKWQIKIGKLLSSRKSVLKGLLLVVLVISICILTGGYSYYYQRTTMTKRDTENIVTAYYLLEQIQEQLLLITKEEVELEKVSTNIHTLAVRIASFSAKKASDSTSEEGQLLLNRYYAKLGQFGVNLSSQDFQDLTTKLKVGQEYIGDIERIEETQKVVFNFYKIKEASLKEKE